MMACAPAHPDLALPPAGQYVHDAIPSTLKRWKPRFCMEPATHHVLPQGVTRLKNFIFL